MLNLNIHGVEIFINKTQTEKINTFWDNYDLIIWEKDSTGFTRVDGMYRKDSWGIAKRVAVSTNGIWKLPKKYVRYFK